MFEGFNSTSVVLVPKRSNPNTAKDFRPISCCNVVYKLLSTLNRLKLILPDIIAPNQIAFVPGRGITDNILLAHELVRGYKRKSLSSGLQVEILICSMCCKKHLTL